VALEGGRYLDRLGSADIAELRGVVRGVEARRRDCRGRALPLEHLGEIAPAEQALHKEAFTHFHLDTRSAALAHPRGNYGWMFNARRSSRNWRRRIRSARSCSGRTGVLFRDLPPRHHVALRAQRGCETETRATTGRCWRSHQTARMSDQRLIGGMPALGALTAQMAAQRWAASAFRRSADRVLSSCLAQTMKPSQPTEDAALRAQACGVDGRRCSTRRSRKATS